MNISITTIQSDLYWENKKANLDMFSSLIKKVPKESKIVVLPEMFTTGFSTTPKNLAESMEGESVKWMLKQAIISNKNIVGSLIIKEDNTFFNRLIVAQPNEELFYYDKRHLFRYADEHLNYEGGNDQLILNIEGVKFAFFVCYDLRFPVWSRNIKLKYDAAIYIANWPEKRRDHWITLLKARAIENQAFIVGVNRIGCDGKGISHSGDSMVFNPMGKKISTTHPNESIVETTKLNLELLNNYRAKFPAYLDVDDFTIHP